MKFHRGSSHKATFCFLVKTLTKERFVFCEQLDNRNTTSLTQLKVQVNVIIHEELFSQKTFSRRKFF